MQGLLLLVWAFSIVPHTSQSPSQWDAWLHSLKAACSMSQALHGGCSPSHLTERSGWVLPVKSIPGTCFSALFNVTTSFSMARSCAEPSRKCRREHWGCGPSEPRSAEQRGEAWRLLTLAGEKLCALAMDEPLPEKGNSLIFRMCNNYLTARWPFLVLSDFIVLILQIASTSTLCGEIFILLASRAALSHWWKLRARCLENGNHHRMSAAVKKIFGINNKKRAL